MSSSDGSPIGSELHLEKSTGFDASPYAEREPTLTRRSTRLTDPRSPLSRWTSAVPPEKPLTHPLAHEKTTADALVDFDGPDDPYRPINWTPKKKWLTVLFYGLTTMCSSWNSSMLATPLGIVTTHQLTISRFGSDIVAVGKEYHVATVVSTLGVTAFSIWLWVSFSLFS